MINRLCPEMTTERKVYLVLVIALTAIIGLSLVSYLNVHEYLQVTASIDRVQLLRDSIGEYFDAMQDAETGQRGYLFTGREPYLEPYNNAVRVVQKSLIRLEARSQELGIGADSVAMLRQLTGDKVAELHHTINLRRNDGFDAALSVVLDDSGKSAMDQIRIIVAEVQINAQNEIRRMEARSEASRERSILFALAFALVVTAMLIVAARVIIADLRKRESLSQQLSEQASRDPLTNLPNRRFFLDMAQYALAQAKRNDVGVAIMFVDLDGFKTVNDTFGHEGGDKLLIDVAERFKATIRETDLLARLGGDEFAILIHEVNATEELATLATRLIACLMPVNFAALQERHVGASIGIAVAQHDAIDAVQLLAKADQAMYGAKRAGKNRFKFFGENVPQTPSHETYLQEEIA